jgi:thiamine biosynthesis lipoprotein
MNVEQSVRWVGIVLALLLPADGPGERLSRFEYVETHMGSPFKIVLYSPDEATARRASRAAFDRIAALDAAFSDYRPDSELMLLCEKAGGPPVPISDDLLDILLQSRTIYERSGGAFDVTVGPVVRLWRRARRDRKMPDAQLLARARSLVSSDLMRIDPKAKTVQLLRPGMKLDLGGIAKGYASNAAISVLRSQGVTRALVAGAGDIVASGPPPGRDGWTIGIAPLDDPQSRPERYISLRDAAVSTSGDAERFVVIDGKRYSHIVDPRTGLGVVDRCSVTVVARDGATADALDTAVFVLGPERGLALVEATDGAAALIVRSEGGVTKSYESSRFRNVPRGQPGGQSESVLSSKP